MVLDSRLLSMHHRRSACSELAHCHCTAQHCGNTATLRMTFTGNIMSTRERERERGERERVALQVKHPHAPVTTQCYMPPMLTNACRYTSAYRLGVLLYLDTRAITNIDIQEEQEEEEKSFGNNNKNHTRTTW